MSSLARSGFAFLHQLVRFARSKVLPLSAALLCAYPVMAQTSNWGDNGDIRVVGDFDGDGKLDYALWRPSTGTWYIHLFNPVAVTPFYTVQWGLPGDIPVPGDYNGDGTTDYAVWRPSNGTWYIMPSTLGTGAPTGAPIVTQWGLSGDIPVTGDYDGDKKFDVAVWRPSNGTWYVVPSSTGIGTATQWGLNGDVPLAADWDGDGKQDMAVWRPSSGVWYIIPSATPGSPIIKQWGQMGDVPLPANYDLNTLGTGGSGQSNYAVSRPSNGNMYLIMPSNPNPVSQSWGPPNGGPAINLVTSEFSLCEVGKAVYVRITGDFDGDGQPDFAFWRPDNGLWYIVPSSNPSQSYDLFFGLPGDVPVAADYDGDGITDIAVWRPSNGTWYVIPSSGTPPNTTNPAAQYTVSWGLPGDIPVLGDFNGDGTADYAVWRPSNGTWYIMPSTKTTGAPTGTPIIQQWGLQGDVPVAGDYDGDKKTDMAVWRQSNGTWFIIQSSTGAPLIQQWGQPGDLPVAGDFTGDHRADFAVWRPSGAIWFVMASNGAGSYTQSFGVAGNELIYAQPPLTTSFLGPDAHIDLENAFIPYEGTGSCEAH